MCVGVRECWCTCEHVKCARMRGGFSTRGRTKTEFLLVRILALPFRRHRVSDRVLTCSINYHCTRDNGRIYTGPWTDRLHRPSVITKSRPRGCSFASKSGIVVLCSGCPPRYGRPRRVVKRGPVSDGNEFGDISSRARLTSPRLQPGFS
ncbi:hypothetical protein PUN28_000672 [Cardiocondyla obscurior]|uniref:Uncharacterized protein n=1 Tax=Cardiocondyla obscurior TaxID=286306 RepID=A0AAW2H0J4_9HYME